MATTVVNTGRSFHGCWTCRIRRKKCDENRPTCSTCASLELECHGYGPKPNWMDRGVLEREQALKIKHSVSQTKSKRQRRRLHQTVRSPENLRPELDSLSIEKVSSTFHLPNSTHGTVEIRNNGAPQENLQFQISEKDLRTFDESMWSASFYNTIFPAEPIFNQEDNITVSNRQLSDTTTAIKNVDLESNSLSSGSSEREFLSIPISPSAHEADSGWGNDASREDIQLDANVKALDPFRAPTLSTSCYDTHLSSESISKNRVGSVSSSPKGRYASWPTAPSQSYLCGDSDDALFMHYLDQTFHIQYPFYHSANRQGRGWLFSILRRVKSAYHAALASSEFHQHLTRPPNSSIASDVTRLRAKDGHYDLALREMQLSIGQSRTWSGTLGLIRAVETLSCILQLIFCELFCGGMENWRMHLGAAATLLPTLVQAYMVSATQSSIGSGQGVDRQDERILHSEDDTAIRLLLGSFISFDIISCASTRSNPFLGLDHKLTLERAGIHLENLTGCENWAMIFILEISFLDKWKKESEKTLKLSIVELAKRGGQIEQRLREKLADIENKYSIGTSSGSTSGMSSASTHTEITKIFALAAMIYLHVVISGAHPELPEIMDSVSKTIVALQNLTDAKLLRNLVWPFCISGCLALERQQAYFRGFISAAGITQSTVGTFLEAFKIMEECWEIRKTCSYNCDWVFVMNKRGQHVLLA